MGRTRPVQRADIDEQGWDFYQDPPGSRVSAAIKGPGAVKISFVFETDELDEDEVPVLQPEAIPVLVLEHTPGKFTCVLMDAPVTPASICMFSELELPATTPWVPVIAPAVAETKQQELDARVAARPQEAAALFLRGQLRKHRGDVKGAVADFTLGLKLQTEAGAFIARGMCHGLLGDEAAARADLLEAAKQAHKERDRDLADDAQGTLEMLDHAFGGPQ